MMRILLAGLVGAIAMFAWTSIAHVATPLGSIGLSQIPNEAPVLGAMQGAMGDKRGLYFFPWVDPNDPQAMARQEDVMKTHPSGLLLYTPPGAGIKMMPALLVQEFAKEFIECLIAAFLLSLTVVASYVGRAGFVALLGVAAGITTNASYWIWYGFPTDYSLAYTFIDVVAYVVAGLAIAAVLKPRTA